MTGVSIGVGVAGAAVSAGVSAAAGSAGKKGIKGPSDEAVFKGLAAQQLALVKGQEWANLSQEQQQAVLEDYYQKAVAQQQPYAQSGQAGLQALQQYVLGTPAQAAQEARAASGTDPQQAAEITNRWNDISGRYTAGQQAISDAKAKLDQAAAQGYSSKTAPAILKAQQDYVNAQKSVEAINSDYWNTKQQFEAIQPYQAAQEARAAVAAQPGIGSEDFQTTTKAGWNGRAAPTFTPYDKAIPEFNQYKPPPEFQKYKAAPEFKAFGEAIPEYKKLTEAEMIANDPGYQFRLNQGTAALQNSALAKGGFFSGNTGQALQDYGQNYASNEFSNANDRNVQNYDIGLNKWKLGYGKNAEDYNNTLQGWEQNNQQNNQNFNNQLTSWEQGNNQNNQNFNNQLTGWQVGNEANINNYKTAEGGWLDEYNAFVNNQNNQYNKILGLANIGQNAAGTIGNYTQQTGVNVANTIGNKYAALADSQNSYADNLQGTLTGRDAANRDAAAQRGAINANTIGAIGNNLGTGALLAYSQYKGGGQGGSGQSGGGSPTSNLNNSIASAFAQQTPSYRWS